MSPPDTELYKALADSLRRRAPGAVVAPDDPGRLHRQLGVPELRAARLRLEPVRVDDEELRRIHGNDERLSLENIRAGVRAYTEMLLAVAAAASTAWPARGRPDDPARAPRATSRPSSR